MREELTYLYEVDSFDFQPLRSNQKYRTRYSNEYLEDNSIISYLSC